MGRKKRKARRGIVIYATSAKMKEKIREARKQQEAEAERRRFTAEISENLETEGSREKEFGCVVVRNISYITQAQSLVEFLRGLLRYFIHDLQELSKAIVRARIDSEHGRPKGSGHVLLRSREYENFLVSMDNKYPLLGRTVRIRRGGRQAAWLSKSWRNRFSDSSDVYPIRSFLLCHADDLRSLDGKSRGIRIMWESTITKKCFLQISAEQRCLHIQFWDQRFDITRDGRNADYFRATIPLVDIVDHMKLVHDYQSGQMILTFSVRRPARIYRRIKDQESPEPLGVLLSTLLGGTRNTFQWEYNENRTPDSAQADVETGEMTWDRTVDPTASNAFLHCDLYGLVLDSISISNLSQKDRGLLDELASFKLIRTPRPVLTRAFVVKSLEVLIQSRRFDGSHAFFNTLPFSVRYMLHCLVSCGRMYERTIDDALIRLLKRTPEAIATTALEKVLSECGIDYLRKPEQEIGEIINELHHENDECALFDEDLQVDDTGSTMTKVRHVTITPVGTFCWKPELEVSNRVLRNYRGIQDSFLRVNFMEEDMASVIMTTGKSVYERFEKMLSGGFWVAGRRFVFLAFSNAQLREHGCWLYAEGPTGPTVDSVRRWMGDFSAIQSVGKYGARLGQCFSSSVGTVTVKQREVCEIPDVWSSDRRYCFSDGVGMISRQLARSVVASLDLSSPMSLVPSAFQIRFGGCKGMLTVVPDAWIPKGHRMAIRPSQRKFESSHRELEIVGFARPMAAFLNRQLISVLSALEIPDGAFHNLYERYVERLNRVLRTGFGALEVLGATGMGLGGAKVTGTNPSMSVAVEMLRSGFHPQREPHLFELLEAWRARMFLELREKAKIFVPDGVSLYGVMDETRTLKEGQVFVQFRENTPDGNGSRPLRKIVRETVLVCRNPSLHPGDIRVLEAVDNQWLGYLENVVVFPALGARPHASEMSGGDLDGDIFLVIWDESLIPPKLEEPADYAAPTGAREPDPRQHGIASSDLISFFVGYMQNDNLGRIANAHLAWADKSPQGVKCEACLTLAAEHSKAVDFAKTGVPACFPPALRLQEWPDFMEKTHLRSYASPKILGQLYRMTKLELDAEARGCLNPREKGIAVDKHLLLPGRHAFKARAVYSYERYVLELIGIMRRFMEFDEGQIMSGHVKQFFRSARSKSKHGDLQSALNRQISALKFQYKEEFENELEDSVGWKVLPEDQQNLKRLEKASAWYEVAYSEGSWNDYVGDSERILSFAWINEFYLSMMKREAYSVVEQLSEEVLKSGGPVPKILELLREPPEDPPDPEEFQSTDTLAWPHVPHFEEFLKASIDGLTSALGNMRFGGYGLTQDN